ncbi:uncharacterized protein O3C94_017894 [Discoglossus pictus]
MFSWHKTFAIVPPWKKGKKTSEGEVVLTHMKKLVNEDENKAMEPQNFLNGHLLLQTGMSSNCQCDSPIKDEQSKLVYNNSLCEMGVSDSIHKLKRLYKFESEDSGVELPSGANSPSTPKGSEKSFVVHSRDSSCDSGVLSASSSPTVGHMEIKACMDEEESHAFLSHADHIEDYSDVKENVEDPESTMKDFIDCQMEDEELRLSPCNNQTCFEYKPTPDDISSPEHSKTVEEESKMIDDFLQDTFDGIEELHVHKELKRCPTSDSLDEYMDECCRLSEVNQGASKILGSGFGYLEHICQLIEKIGQLQEHNLKLQKQIFSLQKEDRMKQMKEEYFGQHCSCGAASVLLSSYLDTKNHFGVRRNRPHSMFVLSGNHSDLSMIPENTGNQERLNYKGAFDGRSSPSVLGFRKTFNKMRFDECDAKQMWEGYDREASPQPEQDGKKLENHSWGRVRDLLKKSKTRNQNKLGLTSTSLKRSCPQLYRPDILPCDIKRKDRNSMIILGQNPKRESAWSSLYLLNRKEEDM